MPLSAALADENEVPFDHDFYTLTAVRTRGCSTRPGEVDRTLDLASAPLMPLLARAPARSAATLHIIHSAISRLPPGVRERAASVSTPSRLGRQRAEPFFPLALLSRG